MIKNYTIFIPAFVSLFWAIFFLLNWKRNSRSQHIWAVAMGLITITTSVSAFYWNYSQNYSLYYKLDILDCFSTLSFVPVIFLYFKVLTGDTRKTSTWGTVLLFIPPVLLGGVTAIAYWSIGEEQSIAFIRNMLENHSEEALNLPPPYTYIRKFCNEYTYSISLLLQTTFVLIYIIRRLYTYQKQLEGFFSNLEGKSIEHSRAVLRGLILFLVLLVATAGFGYTLYVEYDIWVSVIMTLIGVVLYYICYHVNLSNYTADSFVSDLALSENVVPEQEQEPIGFTSKIKSDFICLMEDEQVFLNKDLHLDDVAQMIHSNRTYISRLIHDEFNCNFSEYINGLRIEYAKNLLQQNPHYTQEYIATQSGFSHSSSFSRTFKKQTGITFREWQRNIL
ncbi:AraC family transcriptional regulator [Bacteroides sp. 519]|uniref:helix-turn-helix domain-containing protein n=1 Tax=Bacteroides sp. 519 TaxID=2302937 RepID=UPI0013D26F96|nr:helix-turn-helix domain-containing protein [Bacteroides sp. 519]NDV59446.1 helix-turn-helix domain-containing protein [Bacteroides sp. 519]